jgi:hypothetical protein
LLTVRSSPSAGGCGINAGEAAKHVLIWQTTHFFGRGKGPCALLVAVGCAAAALPLAGARYGAVVSGAGTGGPIRRRSAGSALCALHRKTRAVALIWHCRPFVSSAPAGTHCGNRCGHQCRQHRAGPPAPVCLRWRQWRRGVPTALGTHPNRCTTRCMVF